MAQTVEWTTSVQIAGIPFFSVTERLQVQSVGRMNIDLPAGAENQIAALLAGENDEIALLMINATLYVDPTDSSKTLQINVATGDNPISLQAPFFLTDRRLLKAILGENGLLSISNPIQRDVGVEIMFCRAAQPPTQPVDGGVVGPAVAMAVALQDPVLAPEDLTQIKGIGPTYQQRLQDAGFHTLAQLAAASADDLKAAIGAKPWHVVDVASWIEQARSLIQSAGAL